MDNDIRNLREAAGVTQEALAERLQVSRQTIISLERGRYDPSIRLAFSIARYFGRSIEEVFHWEEEAEGQRKGENHEGKDR